MYVLSVIDEIKDWAKKWSYETEEKILNEKTINEDDNTKPINPCIGNVILIGLLYWVVVNKDN